MEPPLPYAGYVLGRPEGIGFILMEHTFVPLVWYPDHKGDHYLMIYVQAKANK